ncbi:hypothetical protein KGV55_02215 [Candidatus Gracilibacteria bacterium]|nr:hypothetical protein [Candidatus Gracilibacteria bacterium]
MSALIDLKQKILASKEYIQDFYKKNGNSPEVRKNLSDSFLKEAFGDEIDLYNEKTERFTEKMQENQNKLVAIEKKKQKEKEGLNGIGEVIKKHIDILNEEYRELEDIRGNLKEYKNDMGYFKEKFEESTDKINELTEILQEYEFAGKKDIKTAVDELKEKMEAFSEEIQPQITKKLKEKAQEVLGENFEKERRQLDAIKRVHLHFDWMIFIKYFLLIGGAIALCCIDFFLVQAIVIEEFNLSRSASPQTVFLVTYIIPLIPSVILLGGEFIVRKFLKNDIGFQRFISILYWFIVFFIILTVFFTFKPK